MERRRAQVMTRQSTVGTDVCNIDVPLLQEQLYQERSVTEQLEQTILHLVKQLSGSSPKSPGTQRSPKVVTNPYLEMLPTFESAVKAVRSSLEEERHMYDETRQHSQLLLSSNIELNRRLLGVASRTHSFHSIISTLNDETVQLRAELAAARDELRRLTDSGAQAESVRVESASDAQIVRAVSASLLHLTNDAPLSPMSRSPLRSLMSGERLTRSSPVSPPQTPWSTSTVPILPQRADAQTQTFSHADTLDLLQLQRELNSSSRTTSKLCRRYAQLFNSLLALMSQLAPKRASALHVIDPEDLGSLPSKANLQSLIVWFRKVAVKQRQQAVFLKQSQQVQQEPLLQQLQSSEGMPVMSSRGDSVASSAETRSRRSSETTGDVRDHLLLLQKESAALRGRCRTLEMEFITTQCRLVQAMQHNRQLKQQLRDTGQSPVPPESSPVSTKLTQVDQHSSDDLSRSHIPS
eukprot:TRINITY_DN11431_c0_g1_i1.p1 TRINITY_DN11431_c0_g1~~TRINITY_DN11431_c0_g1_i1.p1  ORF type:complete len:465 (+),score=78.24 TRINITY_DN11431_c0_g1_i1:237-1631(+)